MATALRGRQHHHCSFCSRRPARRKLQCRVACKIDVEYSCKPQWRSLGDVCHFAVRRQQRRRKVSRNVLTLQAHRALVARNWTENWSARRWISSRGNLWIDKRTHATTSHVSPHTHTHTHREREFICQVNDNNNRRLVCYNNYNGRLPHKAYAHQWWPAMISKQNNNYKYWQKTKQRIILPCVC